MNEEREMQRARGSRLEYASECESGKSRNMSYDAKGKVGGLDKRQGSRQGSSQRADESHSVKSYFML